MTRVWSGDVCVIGGGCVGAAVAQRLSESKHRRLRVAVLDAGKVFSFAERFSDRARYLDYGENPWPGDELSGFGVEGDPVNTMAVGGRALHWGGRTPRFTREDFRGKSLFGVGTDWPISYDDLEPYYCQAESLIGISGTPLPDDEHRSHPYPMPAFPLNTNLIAIQAWAKRAGIRTGMAPYARNSRAYDGRSVCMRCDTCEVCPTGAKYTAESTLVRLAEKSLIDLRPNTFARQLELDGDRIVRAVASDLTTGEAVTFEAKLFVVAAGYIWSPTLLLNSANDRYPRGLANSADLVGKYVSAQRTDLSFLHLEEQLYPGIHDNVHVLSTQFMKTSKDGALGRFALGLGTSEPAKVRLRDGAGKLLLGRDALTDWRERNKGGNVWMNAFSGIIPAQESSIVLNPDRKDRFGKPLPSVRMKPHADMVKVEAAVKAKFEQVAARLVKAGARRTTTAADSRLFHQSGGCRMAAKASDGVCDSFGRTFDHQNLYVVGAPTCVSTGCTNPTLTFVALSLRSADHMLADLRA